MFLHYYVCTAKGCSRVTTQADEESKHWILARRVSDPAFVVVRCPQHITVKSARMAGIKLTNAFFKQAAEYKRIDARSRRKSEIPLLGVIPVDPEVVRTVLGTRYRHGWPEDRKRAKEEAAIKKAKEPYKVKLRKPKVVNDVSTLTHTQPLLDTGRNVPCEEDGGDSIGSQSTGSGAD